MTTSHKMRRLIRLAATLAAIAGLLLIAATYATGGLCSPAATALIGGALITHWLIRPENRKGRAA